MIQGLLDGAGSLLSTIGSFFLDKIPGWIQGPFKKALGISSPSKVFAGYGMNIMEGAIIGIEKKQRAIQQSMFNASRNITDAFNPNVSVGADYSRVGTNSSNGAGNSSSMQMFGNINIANDADGDRFLTEMGMIRDGELAERGMAI